MAVKKRGGQPNNSNARKTFYNPSLLRASQFAEASNLDGLDAEIILFRMTLRSLVLDNPSAIDAQIRCGQVISNLVKVRFQIASGQKSILKDSITKVLEEIAKPIGVKKIL
jgi:hypothetical protein